MVKCSQPIIYTLLTLFGILISFNSQSQDMLEQYRQREIDKINQLISLHEKKTKQGWLNLLPDFSYNFNNSTVSVGINLNSFASYVQTKKRNKIELEKLRLSYINQLDNKIIRLSDKYLNMRNDYNTLSLNFNALKEQYLIVQINKERYVNNKINLLSWLDKKNAYIHYFNNVLNAIQKLEADIQVFQLTISDNTALNDIKNSLKKIRDQLTNLSIK